MYFANYENDKEHGPISTYENDVLIYKCNYFYNKLHGEVKSWYQNGKLESVTNYIYGLKCGEYIHYDQDQNIKSYGTYDDNKLHGIRTMIDKDGKITTTKYHYGLIID